MKNFEFLLTFLCFILWNTSNAQLLDVEGDFHATTFVSDYLFPNLDDGDPYRYIRFGDPDEYYAGFMWNNTNPVYGDGDDFAIFTYDDRDIVLVPNGSGNTHIRSKLIVPEINIGSNVIKSAGTGILGIPGTMRPLSDNIYDFGLSNRRWRTIYGHNMSIGVSNSIPSGYRLAVDGNVIAERIRVRLSGNWPDYVFQSDYELMSIDDLKNCIQEKGHLPNMPDAETVKSENQDLGEVQLKLLEKIEELTLYIIELNDRIKDLEKENEGLKK